LNEQSKKENISDENNDKHINKTAIIEATKTMVSEGNLFCSARDEHLIIQNREKNVLLDTGFIMRP
jgi:hypothetical protein